MMTLFQSCLRFSFLVFLTFVFIFLANLPSFSQAQPPVLFGVDARVTERNWRSCIKESIFGSPTPAPRSPCPGDVNDCNACPIPESGFSGWGSVNWEKRLDMTYLQPATAGSYAQLEIFNSTQTLNISFDSVLKWASPGFQFVDFGQPDLNGVVKGPIYVRYNTGNYDVEFTVNGSIDRLTMGPKPGPVFNWNFPPETLNMPEPVSYTNRYRYIVSNTDTINYNGVTYYRLLPGPNAPGSIGYSAFWNISQNGSNAPNIFHGRIIANGKVKVIRDAGYPPELRLDGPTIIYSDGSRVRREEVYLGNTVEFSEFSFDPDNVPDNVPINDESQYRGLGIANRTWTITYPNGTQISPVGSVLNFSPNLLGQYRVEIVVTDDEGETTQKRKDFIVGTAKPILVDKIKDATITNRLKIDYYLESATGNINDLAGLEMRECLKPPFFKKAPWARFPGMNKERFMFPPCANEITPTIAINNSNRLTFIDNHLHSFEMEHNRWSSYMNNQNVLDIYQWYQWKLGNSGWKDLESAAFTINKRVNATDNGNTRTWHSTITKHGDSSTIFVFSEPTPTTSN